MSTVLFFLIILNVPQALVIVSKVTDLEINAEKTKYKVVQI
jgi:hypothetical protein